MPLLWGIVTEIKCNIFGRVWLLKNFFFFFSNAYISVNTIFECCYFFFWLRRRPSIKYVRKWGNGEGSSKMFTGAYRERGVEKLVIRYLRTKSMAPNKFCWIFFVHWFSKVHYSVTASNKNVHWTKNEVFH